MNESSTDRLIADLQSLDQDLRAQLNLETGRIQWRELAPHFARGVVVRVAPELDLVEVALRFAQDDRPQVERWLASGDLARASDDDARAWSAADTSFWAVVAAPWVLVQPGRLQ